MAEGTNRYETVLVTSAKLGDDGNTKLVERFKDRIAKHGTIEEVDDWGKRRLAYPINKETEGYYTLIYFESTPDFTAELDRRYQITDGVLRSLIIKRDPRHIAADEAMKKRRADAESKESKESVDVEAIAVETAPATEVVEETKETPEVVEETVEVPVEPVAETAEVTTEETAE